MTLANSDYSWEASKFKDERTLPEAFNYQTVIKVDLQIFGSYPNVCVIGSQLWGGR